MKEFIVTAAVLVAGASAVTATGAGLDVRQDLQLSAFTVPFFHRDWCGGCICLPHPLLPAPVPGPKFPKPKVKFPKWF
jgi:hypothetical protein